MAWALIIAVAWIVSLRFVYGVGRLQGETDAMNESTAFLRTLTR